MSARQEVFAAPETTLTTFLRLFMLDEDLGIRFVREVNGRRQLTTITLEPDGSHRIVQEVDDPRGDEVGC